MKASFLLMALLMQGLFTSNAVESSVINSSVMFTNYLMVGSISTDVRLLQRVLNSSSDTQVAVQGDGSPGHETLNFDDLTKAALIKFQSKFGLPATGFAGPLTLAVLNSLDLSKILDARITYIFKIQDSSAIALMGNMKLNTSYNLEVSTDLKNWENLGRIEGNAYGVLKEPIRDPAQFNSKYKNSAFFRLVELP